jgi:hypothetical protein
MRDTVVSNARDMRPHRVRFLHLLPAVRVLVVSWATAAS